MTELWRKESHAFVVEIKVGASWVQHATHGLETDARLDAERMSQDASVSAVRLLEHALTQRCTVLDEFAAANVLRLPPKMTPTGKNASCPRCTLLSQVASDGTTEWIFCLKCGSAFPA